MTTIKNPNSTTWKERAKEYLIAKDNPLADQKYINSLIHNFELIDITNLSVQDKELLYRVLNT